MLGAERSVNPWRVKRPNAPGERRPTGTEPRVSTEPALWAVRSTGFLGLAATNDDGLSDFVVPTLLLFVPRNPEEAQTQRQH